jgi:hypothetical protein
MGPGADRTRAVHTLWNWCRVPLPGLVSSRLWPSPIAWVGHWPNAGSLCHIAHYFIYRKKGRSRWWALPSSSSLRFHRSMSLRCGAAKGIALVIGGGAAADASKGGCLGRLGPRALQSQRLAWSTRKYLGPGQPLPAANLPTDTGTCLQPPEPPEPTPELQPESQTRLATGAVSFIARTHCHTPTRQARFRRVRSRRGAVPRIHRQHLMRGMPFPWRQTRPGPSDLGLRPHAAPLVSAPTLHALCPVPSGLVGGSQGPSVGCLRSCLVMEDLAGSTGAAARASMFH